MGSEQNDDSESSGLERDSAANGPEERASDEEVSDHESARQDSDEDLADHESAHQEPAAEDAVAEEPAGDTGASSTDSAPGSTEPSAVTDEEQTWGVLVHASALAGLAIPFGNVLAPLLLWLVKKDESEFVDASGTEAINFQLTWTLLLLGASLTILVGVGLLIVPVIAVAWLVLVVLATIRASEREVYDYPLTIDFVN